MFRSFKIFLSVYSKKKRNCAGLDWYGGTNEKTTFLCLAICYFVTQANT